MCIRDSTYVVEWGAKTARFWVDGQVVLDCITPPRGPLGLVIWLDNQFMVVTPQGRLRHGMLAKPGEQWMEIESVRIEQSPKSVANQSYLGSF